MPRPKIDDKERQSAELVTQLRPADAAAWRALLAPGETPSAALRKLVLKDLRKRQRKAAAKPLASPAEPAAASPQSPLEKPRVRVPVGGGTVTMSVRFGRAPEEAARAELKAMSFRFDPAATAWVARLPAERRGEVEALVSRHGGAVTVLDGPGGANG